MERAHLRAPPLAQVVDSGFNILRGRPQRHEDRVGIVGPVLADQTVVTACELSEVLVSLFQELQYGLGEVVPPRHNALHIVLLVLDRAQKHRVCQVDHGGNPAAFLAEEYPLALGGAVNHVVGCAQILANQLRLVLVERPLQMGREKAVHDVHAGGQAELRHAPQDQRLVGGLLGVFAKDDDPPGVERAVDIIVPAMHIQGMFGKGASRNFQYHRRALARGVIILLNAVDDPLARRVIDHSFSAHRVRDGPALGRVLAFGLNGDGVAAKYVEFALGKRLLVQLTAFGRWGNGIEHTRLGNARFGVVGNQLVS
ncbi:MAG: hypothetical protein SGI92_31315, partial [Bryobacteraceae bacterium]|nr:hypothetical protein [Bryobacteraceae bacterium]